MYFLCSFVPLNLLLASALSKLQVMALGIVCLLQNVRAVIAGPFRNSKTPRFTVHCMALEYLFFHYCSSLTHCVKLSTRKDFFSYLPHNQDMSI